MVKLNKLHNKIGVFDIFNIIFLTLIVLTMLYPFLNILFISLSSVKEVMSSGSLMLYPKAIHFDSYLYVLKYGGLFNAFKVTLFITIVGTVINLIMTTLGAYVVSNKELPGRNILMSVIIFTMFFSGGLIPNYIIMQKIGLIDSVWVLILPGAINTFYLILMRNFFQSIPRSLVEAARIDGASEIKTLLRIIIPVSTPIIATLALFYGVNHWNEYTQAVIYINTPDRNPLQVLIRSMYDASINIESDTLPPPVESVRNATVMLATLPIICLYPFLQRYFVTGIMVGSVKG